MLSQLDGAGRKRNEGQLYFCADIGRRQNRIKMPDHPIAGDIRHRVRDGRQQTRGLGHRLPHLGQSCGNMAAIRLALHFGRKDRANPKWLGQNQSVTRLRAIQSHGRFHQSRHRKTH